MRGDEERQEGFIMLSSGEDVVSLDHPLRTIRRMVDRALSETGSPRRAGSPEHVAYKTSSSVPEPALS